MQPGVAPRSAIRLASVGGHPGPNEPGSGARRQARGRATMPAATATAALVGRDADRDERRDRDESSEVATARLPSASPRRRAASLAGSPRSRARTPRHRSPARSGAAARRLRTRSMHRRTRSCVSYRRPSSRIAPLMENPADGRRARHANQRRLDDQAYHARRERPQVPFAYARVLLLRCQPTMTAMAQRAATARSHACQRRLVKRQRDTMRACTRSRRSKSRHVRTSASSRAPGGTAMTSRTGWPRESRWRGWRRSAARVALRARAAEAETACRGLGATCYDCSPAPTSCRGSSLSGPNRSGGWVRSPSWSAPGRRASATRASRSAPPPPCRGHRPPAGVSALDRLMRRSQPPDELLPNLAAAYPPRSRAARPSRRAGAAGRLRAELAGGTRAQFAWIWRDSSASAA